MRMVEIGSFSMILALILSVYCGLVSVKSDSSPAGRRATPEIILHPLLSAGRG